MSRLLDYSKEDSIAENLISELQYEGFTPTESIPGLMRAIIAEIAELDENRGPVLDEVTNFFADYEIS